MLEGYSEYKDINTSWLHSVPKNWVSAKIGELFEERKIKVSDKKYAPLTVGKMGVVPQLSTVAKSNDSDNRKLVKAGDYVINSRSDRKGSSGLSSLDGSVSLINIVLNPREGNGKYYHYLLRSYYWIEEYYRNGRGIVADLWTTRFSEMKSIVLPIPPRPEQDQIVRYLDWKVSMINRYINAKKKQIELLKEHKQAIINQAVTKGLDMNVPMKDSGIEWLGKIPTHWEVMKLKHFAKVNPSIHDFKYDDKDEVVFLPMENISIDGVIDNSIKKRVYEVKNGFSSFAKNDVIIAKITPCFENGKGAFLNNLKSEVGFGTTELINLRAKENILPEYLYLITMSSQFRVIGERTMTGTAGQKRITKSFVSYFTIAIPGILEQEEIIETIKKQINETNKYINNANNKVQLLQEYRTRLISDVVTGKVNVQNVKVPKFKNTECQASYDTDEDVE